MDTGEFGAAKARAGQVRPLESGEAEKLPVEIRFPEIASLAVDDGLELVRDDFAASA